MVEMTDLLDRRVNPFRKGRKPTDLDHLWNHLRTIFYGSHVPVKSQAIPEEAFRPTVDDVMSVVAAAVFSI